MFFIFNRACRKYGFTYVLSTYGRLELMIRPNNSFDNIRIDFGYYNHNIAKLLFKAIKEMKRYRKESGCQ